MRFIQLGTLFLFFYFIYGFYISQTDVRIIPPEIKKENPPGFYDYRGVINVHSNMSIGSSSFSEIVDAARNSGLDFIVFTDLNQFGKPEGVEAYHSNLLSLVGSEYSFVDSRLIYLSADGSPLDADSLGTAQTKLADFLSQQANQRKENLVILAHPFKPGFSWSGDYPSGLDGFEIINPASIASQVWTHNKISILWSLFIYPFSPRLSFLRLAVEPRDEVALWDKLLSNRKIWGYSGANASARAIPLANYLVRFPSYERSFGITSNHVLLKSELTGEYLSDRKKIFSALKRGNFYFSYDILGDPKGFYAKVTDSERDYQMGDTIKFHSGLKLEASLPTQPNTFYEYVLYRDGEGILTLNEKSFSTKITKPGVYRLLVRVIPSLPLPDGKRWMTWIYTNPFFVN